jgi:predicted transcriptional regulator
MDTTIKVDSKTRDRLAVLAEARGTTMRHLIEEFAESTLTPSELKERAAHTAAYLAEHFGVTVTDESSTEALRKVRGQTVAHHAASRSGRGA